MSKETDILQLLDQIAGSDQPLDVRRYLDDQPGSEQLNFITFPKGSFLNHMGMPLNRLLIHLTGEVAVYKYSPSGIGIRGDVSAAPQIYGLYEMLLGVAEHGVDLQAATDVTCLALLPEEFRRLIEQNHRIALHALYFLARFTDRILNRNDQLTLNTPYENLIIYLYERSLGRKPPVLIRENKNEIAQFLNISNRTLYRQLDRLEQEQILERYKGHIRINADAFRILEQKYLQHRGRFNGTDAD